MANQQLRVTDEAEQVPAGPLMKGDFLLGRDNSNEEFWIIAARRVEILPYITHLNACQTIPRKAHESTICKGWHLWDRGTMKPAEKDAISASKDWSRRPQVLHKLVYCYKGTREQAVSSLRAAGIEEQHLEILGR